MLSFCQFVAIHEDRHYAPGVNGDWGFLTKRGTVKSGLHHRGISTHSDLANKLKLGKTDDEAVENGHARFFAMHPPYDSHFTVQSPDSLSVEMSHQSAPKLHKHMSTLISHIGLKPHHVHYDIAHSEKKDKQGEIEHEYVNHREFTKRYGN